VEFALSYYSLLDLSLKEIIATIRRGEEVGIHYVYRFKTYETPGPFF
jgi:hypothetical protein